MKPNNPFLVTGYHSPLYFCDRVEESRKLTDALYNGRNVTLMAPRRMGKTGLIKNVFYQLKAQNSNVVTIYIDIFSTQNLKELTEVLAHAILGQLDSTAQAIMGRVTKFIKSCKPVFTVDEITGIPKVSIEVMPHHEQATLKEIFDYLNSSEKRCYIAIDEFQQITEYPENGVEALLRSFIQFAPTAQFIFSGSRQHVMQEMFQSASRPFYQSTQPLLLDCIDTKEYYLFAQSFFTSNEIILPEDVFNNIYQQFHGHTWYIQSVLNRLYSFSKNVDNELVNVALKEIIEESTYTYQQLMAAYSVNNVNLLKAIAKEGTVTEITASSFILKYKLGAASSVKTSVKKLIERELVYKSQNGYQVYDQFMAIWLQG